MFRGCSRLSRPSTALSRARPRWQRRRHPTTSIRRWRSRSSDRREDLGRRDAAHPALRDRLGRAAAAGDAEGCRAGRHRNAAGSAVAFVDLRHAEGDLSSFAARRDRQAAELLFLAEGRWAPHRRPRPMVRGRRRQGRRSRRAAFSRRDIAGSGARELLNLRVATQNLEDSSTPTVLGSPQRAVLKPPLAPST